MEARSRGDNFSKIFGNENPEETWIRCLRSVVTELDGDEESGGGYRTRVKVEDR